MRQSKRYFTASVLMTDSSMDCVRKWTLSVYCIQCRQDCGSDYHFYLTLAFSVINGAFQTGYIALRSKNNHGRHVEGSFQTEVLKTGHFKGPFGINDFEGYNWWAPIILCTDCFHDDGVSIRARDDDAEGHFKKPPLFGPLHLSTLQSSHSRG